MPNAVVVAGGYNICVMNRSTVPTEPATQRTPPGIPDLSELPDYPRFLPLGPEHKSLMAAAFQAAQLPLTEFTWAYQWVWGRLAHWVILGPREQQGQRETRVLQAL